LSVIYSVQNKKERDYSKEDRDVIFNLMVYLNLK